MDVQVVALAAVTLLGPYLTKAEEAAAKSIGEKTTLTFSACLAIAESNLGFCKF